MKCRWLRSCLVGAVCALTLSFSAPQVRAQTAPLPPGWSAYGLTQGQWLEAFIEWFESIPVSSSPWSDYDTTGVRAGVGQHGPVWFLPVGSAPKTSTFSETVTVTVPEGKAILKGVRFNVASAVPGAMTDASLLKTAQDRSSAALAQFTRIEVSLDGVPVGDLLSYRVQTSVFTIELAPDNFFQQPVTAGKDSRLALAADGIFLLFPPLPVGTHVISHVREGIGGNGIGENGKPFKFVTTYNVQVQKANQPLP